MLGNDSPFPISDAFIGRFETTKGYHTDFLKLRAGRSRSFDVYDFNVKALDTTNQWTVAAGAGATTWAVLAAAGGWIRGVTGTSSGVSGLQLSIPTKYWAPTNIAGMAVLYRLSSITEIRVEMGFADALPAVNTTVVNNTSTGGATFNTATAGAMALYHHSGTSTISGLYTIGTTASGAGVATAAAARPQSSVEHFVVIECNGSGAAMWASDLSGPVAVSGSTALTSTDGLIPFISIKGNDGTSKNVDIDAIFTWSGRLG